MTLAFSTIASLRFGMGFRPGETPPGSVEDLLAQLEAGRRETLAFPDGGPAAARERLADAAQAFAALRLAEKSRDPVSKRAHRLRFRAGLNNLLFKDEHARFMQGVLSPHGFNERLAGFWFDHFSVHTLKEGFTRLLVPLYEAEAIRPNMAGRFADLVKASVLHPAMLIYLDQVKSFGPTSSAGLKRQAGLNENLGRELLELHTLGAGGGYSQEDVRNAAFVLTGMTVDRKTYRPRYSLGMAETGAWSVLGKPYGGTRRGQGDILAMIEDLAAAPQTRAHICTKIARHFLSDRPPADVVAAMEAAWKRHDGELAAVYGAMLRDRQSWENEGQKAKPPFDFIISGLRALSAEKDDLQDRGLAPLKTAMAMPAAAKDTGGAMTEAPLPAVDMPDAAIRKLRLNPLTVLAAARLGQPLWRPPSPAGFDDSFSTWIAGGPLTGRIAWARLAVAKLGDEHDPRRFLRETLGDAARQDTIDIVSKAPNRQLGLALVLASPEFNRR